MGRDLVVPVDGPSCQGRAWEDDKGIGAQREEETVTYCVPSTVPRSQNSNVK